MLIRLILIILTLLMNTDQATTTNDDQITEEQEKVVEIASYQPSELSVEPQPIYVGLGEFTVTAYTAGPESTGKREGDPGYGITASGVDVEEGVTIAADWDVISPGSRVWIEGVGERIVQDRGGAIKGKKLDLYIPELKDALEFGKKKLDVYLILQGGD